MIQQNVAQIGEYRTQLEDLDGSDNSFPTEYRVPVLEMYLTDLPPVVRPNDDQAGQDFWTSISLELSSETEASHAEENSTAYSVGAASRMGLFAVGGLVSGSEETQNAAKQLAGCKTLVYFDCLRVDIERGWLWPELFRDHDLIVRPTDLYVPSPIASHGVMLHTDSLDHIQYLPGSCGFVGPARS